MGSGGHSHPPPVLGEGQGVDRSRVLALAPERLHRAVVRSVRGDPTSLGVQGHRQTRLLLGEAGQVTHSVQVVFK